MGKLTLYFSMSLLNMLCVFNIVCTINVKQLYLTKPNPNYSEYSK